MNWFWVGVKHQSRYNVAAKTTPPFIIKGLLFFLSKWKSNLFLEQVINFWLCDHCQKLLCISPPRKKSDLAVSLVVHSMVKSLSLSILSSPKQFDSTYLRVQNRKMTKIAKKMLPPNMILLFPPCMLRLLELNWHKPTNRCFFHLKKSKSDKGRISKPKQTTFLKLRVRRMEGLFLFQFSTGSNRWSHIIKLLF